MVIKRYEILGAAVLLRLFKIVAYGARHREHEGAGMPIHTMSHELQLLAGRLCDSPGCAESANP